MKANELKCTDLRIGNYVNYENRPFEVIEISPISLVVRKKIGDIFEMQHRALDVAQPIELTEEVLVKIGFKKGYNEIYSKTIKVDFYEYNISYQNVKNNKYSFVASGYNGELKRQIRLDNIQYLHELQNVFFSFTNQELEIKL